VETDRQSRGLTNQEYAESQRPSDDPNRRAYAAALQTLSAAGTAADGDIRIRTEGLRRWKVEIRNGTLHRFDEDEFRTELHAALRQLLTTYQSRVFLLKSKHFDLGGSSEFRKLIERLQRASRRGV
jgi:hypothetical protein